MSAENGISSPEAGLSYRVLESDPFRLRQEVDDDGLLCLRTDQYAVVASALLSLDGFARRVILAPAGIRPRPIPCTSRSKADVNQLARRPQPSARTDYRLATETRWSVYTSGTTGQPKQVEHTLATLTRTTAKTPKHSLVWGGLYDPNRMAGLQVLLQAVLTRQQLFAVDRDASIIQQVEDMAGAGVTALSATPSLWRRILQSPNASCLNLRQVTLGGEIADQTILDALTQAYPEARITHVFASTEVGAAFSVTDGRAGFPTSFLKKGPKGVDLAIRDGVLWVRSPGLAGGDGDGFVSTGDLIELVGERCIFRGRESGLVNVGGTNVAPEEVETILRSHADVVDAVVSARPNPLTGNVLVASVVIEDHVDVVEVSKRLRKWVRQQASPIHVPATVEIVSAIDLASTGKLVR